MPLTPTSPTSPAPPAVGACPARDWSVNVHLPADLHAPRLCRASVVNAVREYGLARELAADGGLVASELMTNAVQHGCAPVSFRVAWYGGLARLRVTVWDAGAARVPVRPVVASPDGEHGRGLLIIARIAADWGQYGMPDGGKAVWAELVPGGESGPCGAR
ncbi:ATP-binding protein [Streptomyces sp. 4N509B]|uniref:ATP-binding protein n=1 Tax=Streptomyces sp. 4N509B TaxID=3457413 RepID=UPI003FD14221